jgi:hypothetical protein
MCVRFSISRISARSSNCGRELRHDIQVHHQACQWSSPALSTQCDWQRRKNRITE